MCRGGEADQYTERDMHISAILRRAQWRKKFIQLRPSSIHQWGARMRGAVTVHGEEVRYRPTVGHICIVRYSEGSGRCKVDNEHIEGTCPAQ